MASKTTILDDDQQEVLDRAGETIARLTAEIERLRADADAEGDRLHEVWHEAEAALAESQKREAALRTALEAARIDPIWHAFHDATTGGCKANEYVGCNVVNHNARIDAALSSPPPPVTGELAEAAAYIEAGEEMRDVLEDAWEHAPADMKDRISRALGGWNNTYHVHHANGAAQRVQRVVAAAKDVVAAKQRLNAQIRERGLAMHDADLVNELSKATTR